MENADAKLARELFIYEPETGLLRWRADRIVMLRRGTRYEPVVRAKAGNVAGTNHNSGYRSVRFNGGLQLAHRVIWLMVYGQWPSVFIDHRNGDRRDNRLENLRQASFIQNARNKSVQSNSKTGIKGVSWSARESKYVVRLKAGGKYHSLGQYDNIDDAAAAYDAAARRHFGHFARTP